MRHGEESRVWVRARLVARERKVVGRLEVQTGGEGNPAFGMKVLGRVIMSIEAVAPHDAILPFPHFGTSLLNSASMYRGR